LSLGRRAARGYNESMRLIFRVLGVGVVSSLIAVACSGSDFSSNGTKASAGSAGMAAKGGGAGQGGTSGVAGDASLAGSTGNEGGAPSGGTAGTVAGTAGTAGTAGGGTTLCSDAKDCDDGKPCTLDTCGADGVCVNAPKCAADQLCCDGVCGECCAQGDCNDDVECTQDVCFAGICSHTPGACTDAMEYCSPTGCVPREECAADADCADTDPCTVDTCTNGLCDHPKCPDGGTCCAGLGCGTCCGDAQCPQTDPCTPSKCGTDLECHSKALCEGQGKCCPSSDGTSAQCGTCCQLGDCPDDGVSCTVEKCTDTGNGTLGCISEPDPSKCMPGQTCSRIDGCSANQCKQAGDCSDPTACKQVACNNGTCNYSDLSCSHGQACCTYSGKCQDCCETKDCGDTSAPLCCKDTGTCAQCCQDSDCQLAMPGGSGGGGSPAALVGGGTTGCSRAFCNMGVCQVEAGKCVVGQKCCEPGGCVPLVQTCGVTTN